MNLKKYIGIGLISLAFFGCANKEELSNQTALFWHNKIYQSLSNYNIDKADDYFTSLEIEHPNSQYIPIDLLILYKAHLKNEEFELALFYINEYEKRYADYQSQQWAEYTKAKIKFLSLTNPYTNQKKVNDTLKFVEEVINKYPNSIYNFELNTIKAKLKATQIVFDNKIAQLYKRLDKPKAVKIYEKNTTQQIIPPYIPWYKKMFYW